MNTIIHYIGNLKEQAYRDLANEFEKRLSAYTKLTNTESKSDDGIIASLKDRSYKIAMCIEGKQLSSEEFAALIEKATSGGNSTIEFVIGGAEGLSEPVKAKCDYRLSMSKMTFTHRMARVLLLEQIYRAFSITAGTKYHK